MFDTLETTPASFLVNIDKICRIINYPLSESNTLLRPLPDSTQG